MSIEETTTADPAPAGEDAPEKEASTDAHLADLPDGSGCAEIWEHLSDGRNDG